MINNTQFFLGVVEDNNDPAQLNRVRVRIFGKHAEDLTLLPTNSLPWYNVVMPVTSASTSGVGQTIGLVQGSWVFGTFTDENQQEALILGSLPGESTEQSQDGEGFKDPNGIYPKASGSDTSKSATHTNSSVYRNRINQMVTDIPIAHKASLSTLEPDAPKNEDESISLPHPDTYSQPQYPYNNVTQTESGHVIEYDDTPGYERISSTHCSGTSCDTIHDGSKIDTIVGDGYTVSHKNNTVYIVGKCNLSVDGDINVKCGGNYVLDVEGDMITDVTGSIKTKVGGELLTEVIGKRAVNIGATDMLKVKDGQSITIGDDQSITVDMNQFIDVGIKQTELIGGDVLNTISGKRETNVAFNDTYICNSQSSITSLQNMKITCPEKIHINTPVARIIGDVIAGSGGVSLITHFHPQPDTGPDSAKQGDTHVSAGGTPVGV